MPNITPTINLKADQCVKCGLCLPHCPTYRLFQDENESPRGRINLIQALARQQISASNTLNQHLDHCLGCRNCERVCPSGVDYGYLLDHSRQLLRQQLPVTGLKKYLSQTALKLTHNKKAQRHLQTLLRYYQKFGLQRILRSSRILKYLRLRRFDNLLPPIPAYQGFKPDYPADTPAKGRLGLFVGCTGNLFDQPTLQKTIRLLQRLGYDVVVPEQQTCCGALHQHQGQLAPARSLAMKNIQTFADLDKVIYIASGCGAQLHDYASLSWPDNNTTEQAKIFAQKTREITAFLSDEDLTSLQFRPLAKKITVHTPCSMRNNLRQTDTSMVLLKHIPELQISSIPAETGCCGAAGSYMLSQPRLAGKIRQATLDVINKQNVDMVSTTNIGCGLHIGAGLSNKTQYTHPVSLLVNQLIF